MTLKTGALLKYGPIINECVAPRIEIGMGASEVIAAKSGRFVVDDGSSRMEMAADGSTLLSGWVELPENGYYTSAGIFTCSATENASKALFTPISACLGTVFRIPVNSGTFAITMINNTCDLSVASNIQGVQLDASAEDTVIVVGGDLENNEWCDVMVNPDKITGLTGVV